MSPFAQTMHSGSDKARSVAATVRRHTPMLNIVTLFLVILLCVAYIIQVNTSITKGYSIRELETSIKQLTLETQQREAEMRKVQTLENVNRAVKMLGFIPAERPVYLTTALPTFALAK